MSYLLDTNICIYVINRRLAAVKRLMQEAAAQGYVMEAASGGGRGPVARQRPGAYTSVSVEKAMGMAYTPRGGAGKDRQRPRRDRVPYRVMLSRLA